MPALFSMSRAAALCLLIAGWGPAHAQELLTESDPDDAVPEVVVTATRVERELFDTPQPVSVITDQEVEEANVLTTPDLFNYTTGVFVQKTNLGGGSPFIRGLTGKQVLILVDGIRLNNSYYRYGPHQYLNTVDPNVIERVEVVRGPSSGLYGSDALGGVINIITKRRNDFYEPWDLDGLLDGTWDTAVSGGSLRAQTDGNVEKFGWVAGLTGKTFNDLEGGEDVGEQVPSAYDEWNGDLKLNWLPAEGHELIFATQYTRQFDVPKTSEVTLGDKLEFDYEPQRRLLTYLEYEGRELTPFLDLATVNVSYNRQEEGEVIIAQSTPNRETEEITDVGTIGTSLQLTSLLGDMHRLTYGVEYYHDHYDTRKSATDLTTGASETLIPGVPDDATYSSLGLYLQDEIRLNDRIEAIPGVRYSRFTAEGTLIAPTRTEQLNLETDAVTFSLNGLGRLTPTLNLVGGISQGFRAPNMEDFFGRVDFFREIPNTELQPEKSLNFDVGLKYFDGRTSGELYYYRANYDQLIERVTVAPGVQQRRNIGEAYIQGIEGALSHRFDKHWSAWVTATWTEGEDTTNNQPLRRIPPLNGSVRVRYTHSPRLWAELDTLFASEQDELSPGDLSDPRIPEGGTPGYAVFNLKGAFHRTPNEQLLVTFANMTNEKYKNHGSGLWAPGRSVVVSYRIELD